MLGSFSIRGDFDFLNRLDGGGLIIRWKLFQGGVHEFRDTIRGSTLSCGLGTRFHTDIFSFASSLLSRYKSVMCCQFEWEARISVHSLLTASGPT